jgi:hypothetical protein
MLETWHAPLLKMASASSAARPSTFAIKKQTNDDEVHEASRKAFPVREPTIMASRKAHVHEASRKAHVHEASRKAHVHEASRKAHVHEASRKANV